MLYLFTHKTKGKENTEASWGDNSVAKVLALQA